MVGHLKSGITFQIFLGIINLSKCDSSNMRSDLTYVPNETTNRSGTGFSELESRQDFLESEVARLKSELQELRGIVTSSNGEYKPKTHKVVKRSASPSQVAFQATIHREISIKDNEVIKFNYVITNIGSGYNEETGIFTAPISGVYHFSTSISAMKDNFIEVSIYKNDQVQVTAVSDTRGTSGTKTWDQGSASAILYLNEGDTVSVRVLYPFGSNNLNGHGKTSFGGYMISREVVRKVKVVRLKRPTSQRRQRLYF